jgi:hypothetical protein
MAVLYFHAIMSPGYVANRSLFKKRYREPFWVRRINEVGRAADNLRSPGRSSSENWVIYLSALFMQYLMAIFILPFLIIAGYVKNYDLLNKVNIPQQK